MPTDTSTPTASAQGAAEVPAQEDTTVIANVEQAHAWDGREGRYWAEEYEQYDLSARIYEARLMEAAAITEREHVLDVGCGNGESTRNAARAATAGTALGVDLSSAMIDRCRTLSRDEGLANTRFLQADAQVHPFRQQSFDVVISRFGAMFFGDHAAAFRNIALGMKPGGRLLFVSWQPFHRQEWMLEIFGALGAGRTLPGPPENGPSPMGLANPDYIRDVLTRAGFTGIDIEDVTAPVHLGADADDALRFLRGAVGWLLDGVEPAAAARAWEELRTRLVAHELVAHELVAHETADGVFFGSSGWLVTARLAG